MNFVFLVFGLAFGAAVLPMAASAQDLFQSGSNLDGTSAAQGGFKLGGNVNPFTSAAGADRYIQDDTTGGVSQPNNPGTPGDSSSLNNFIGGDAADGDGNTGN